MARRTKPRCLECGQVITGWLGRGNRPLFCRKPAPCRFVFNERVRETGEYICARPGCRKPFKQLHISQRFCTKAHQEGCKWCGEPVPPPKAGTRTKNDYCSPEHRDLMWQDEPTPVCEICLMNIEKRDWLLYRDPPKVHNSCIPTTSIKEGMRQQLTNKEILADCEEQLHRLLSQHDKRDWIPLRQRVQIDILHKRIKILQQNA